MPGLGVGWIGLDGSAQKAPRPRSVALTGEDAGCIEVELGLAAGIGALIKALQVCPVVANLAAKIL